MKEVIKPVKHLTQCLYIVTMVSNTSKFPDLQCWSCWLWSTTPAAASELQHILRCEATAVRDRQIWAGQTPTDWESCRGAETNLSEEREERDQQAAGGQDSPAEVQAAERSVEDHLCLHPGEQSQHGPPWESLSEIWKRRICFPTRCRKGDLTLLRGWEQRTKLHWY